MFFINFCKRIHLVIISVFFIIPTISLASISVDSYKNTEVKKVSSSVDHFLYSVLKEYPYLYVNQKETNYNSIFENDPNAFVLVAKRNGKVIGVMQANPLTSPYFKDQDYSPEKSISQIKKKGFSPEKMLYVSTFMISKNERTNSKLTKKMFNTAVELAKKKGDSQICYMEIIEDKDHPLRPNDYISPEPWNQLGRTIKNMGVESSMSWPTLQSDGKVKNESHKMAFYVIDLNETR